MINPFALHYFLWFSALTSIYGYVNVYAAHYANVSSTQYGLLNMVLPFVSIVAKLFFCSTADRYRIHRKIFILFLTTALIGYGSFGVLPFFIEVPQDKNLRLSVWILICAMTSVATISMGVVSSLSDAFAMNSAKKNNTHYGFIRVWGTLGWGASSLVLAYINQSDKLPFLVPGICMTALLISTDLIINSLWKDKTDYELVKSASNMGLEDVVEVLASNDPRANSSILSSLHRQQGNQDYGSNGLNPNQAIDKREVDELSIERPSDLKIQWILFKEVASRRVSIYRYMILFVISGALISLQWSYLFLYLEKIYTEDFTFISSLSMVGQSMLGELPFFILSKYIIKYCGRSLTLTLSIASLGIRYLLYLYLLPNASMYFVLLTEAFAGPGFGLFYVVMTDVGLDYSDCESVIIKVINDKIVDNSPEEIQRLRQALRATMQSLMSACYEGLGVGIGSVIGGIVIDQLGFKILWLYGAAIAFACSFLNLVIDFVILKH